MDTATPPPPAYPNGFKPEERTSTVPPPAYSSNKSSVQVGTKSQLHAERAPPAPVPPPAYTNGARPTESKSSVPPPAYPPGFKHNDTSASANADKSNSDDKVNKITDAKTKQLLNKTKAAADEMSKVRTTYAYTQGSFWGGPNAEFTMLAILACFPFTGFFGIDHHYLRSPMTAALKTLLNIFTLGLWYFYDMGQVLTEANHVKKYGYSVPVFGPIGLGAGLFPEKNQETQGSSPIKFMLYSVAATIAPVFGVDSLVVGDFSGFMAKLFSLPIWIFFMWWNPLYWVAMFCALIWAGYTIYRLWFKTEDLFVRGVARFFPFTLFMDDFRCVNQSIGPNRPCDQAAMKSSSIWSRLFEFFKGIPVIGETVATVEKTVEVAKVAGTVAVEVGKKAVAPVIGAAGAAIKVGSDVISAGKEATTKAAETAQKFTDPEFLAQVAANKSLPTQKGGGAGQVGEGTSNLAIFTLIAATVGASFLTQFLRKSEYVKLIPDIFNKTIKVRNDLPPI